MIPMNAFQASGFNGFIDSGFHARGDAASFRIALVVIHTSGGMGVGQVRVIGPAPNVALDWSTPYVGSASLNTNTCDINRRADRVVVTSTSTSSDPESLRMFGPDGVVWAAQPPSGIARHNDARFDPATGDVIAALTTEGTGDQPTWARYDATNGTLLDTHGVMDSDHFAVTACVDQSGNVYVGGVEGGTSTGFLRKYDGSGNLLVTFSVTTAEIQQLEVGLDGSVYTATTDPLIAKYSSTGTELWKGSVFSKDFSNDIAVTDSRVCAVYGGSPTVRPAEEALDTDGIFQWSLDRWPASYGAARDPDGNFYLSGAGTDTNFVHVDPDGTVLFETRFQFDEDGNNDYPVAIATNLLPLS